MCPKGGDKRKRELHTDKSRASAKMSACNELPRVTRKRLRAIVA